MVLQKIAAISTGSMEVLVGGDSKVSELRMHLDDTLKRILRVDGNRMEGDRDRDVMSRANVGGKEEVMINGGNDFYEMTRVLSLMQMEMDEFNDLLNKIGWQDLVQEDGNGMRFVRRDDMQILSRILRDRTIY
ncbi:MAG: hypothetical protein IPL55_15440 [Saprospiraceae bacterium]|nr:hypothetical protein [Saprospiraceae bacterium]